MPCFPCSRWKYPVFQNIFPVRLSRELHNKSLRHSGFWLQRDLSEPQNRKFPCKIPC
jgi:hypothetical protein